MTVEIAWYKADNGRFQSGDDPLAYWFERRERVPLLYRAAVRAMTVCATSVGSEQLWSQAGQIMHKGRASMQLETLSKLLFL